MITQFERLVAKAADGALDDDQLAADIAKVKAEVLANATGNTVPMPDAPEEAQ